MTDTFLLSQRYSFKNVAELAGIPDALIVGAGAGPAHVVGVNSEVAGLYI